MMMKKLVLLMVVSLLVGETNAYTTWNLVSASPGNWNIAANWTAGLPSVVADGKAVFNKGAAVAECHVTDTQGCVNVAIGDGGPGGDVLRITNGGVLTSTSWLAVGYSRNCQMIVETGGVANLNSHLWMAATNVAATNCILDINGGTVNVGGNIGLGTINAIDPSGGIAFININAGALNLNSWNVTGSIQDGSVIDIESGIMTIVGNQTSAVANYVTALKITAYDGTGTVHYSYNSPNTGKTTVWASSGATYVTVPDVTGLPQATAKSNIIAAGLVVGTVTMVPSGAFDPGDVTSQTPTGGTSVTLGSSVNLVVRPEAGDGDVDGDGYVDGTDLLLFAAEWLDLTPDPGADFTRDGNVNMPDLQILSANWLHNNYSKTLTGKIMCGYQGWFNCLGDGANRNWVHWGASGKFEPGFCTVDWWPDMSQYDADEKFATGFKNADNSTAYVFSSYTNKTVLRHFSWMEEYGIDGVFLQRFATEIKPGSLNLNHCDKVLRNCREGANLHKRAWAVMYDLSTSTLTGPELKTRVINDWKHLVDTYQITQDSTDGAYLHHKGKPVVAVWGLGFERAYEGQDTYDIINFLANDPVYGGCTVMIGVDNEWRARMVTYPLFGGIVQMADIISPWAVGRYGSKNTSELDNFTTNNTVPDQVWCNANNKDYLPVVFPGFSWYNNKYPDATFDQIPRLGGSFLWRQFYKAKTAGATMIYQAMFDEVDEGTAIFKCTSTPPIAELPTSVFSNPFLPTGNAQHPPYNPSDASLPSDHYLWLVGQGTKMLRGEIPLSATMPTR
jgi:hypothetical protein